MCEKMNKTADKLLSLLPKKNESWELFDKELEKNEHLNAFDKKYTATILSIFLHSNIFYHNGALMPEAIRHFISKGYDVRANGGANGTVPMEALCRSSYDRYIVDALKVLLDAGAPLSCELEDDDDSPDFMKSLNWKISGSWGPSNDYETANILEACYNMAEAYEKGKSYEGMDSYHKCIGQPLTAIFSTDSIEELKKENNTTEFSGSLVMWFGAYPLVVSSYVDMEINPLFVSENEDSLSDISVMFEEVSGSKLKAIKYQNSITCYLEFDNGHRMLLSSCSAEGRKRNGLFEIIKSDNAEIENLKIKEIYRTKGKVYSSGTTIYEEEALALVCDDGIYCLFREEQGHKYGIKLIRSSRELLRDYSVKLSVSKISEIIPLRKKENINTLRIKCKEGFLYIKAKDYGALDIILSKEEFALTNDFNFYSLESTGIPLG